MIGFDTNLVLSFLIHELEQALLKAQYLYEKGWIEMIAEDGNYFNDASKDYELPFERSLHVLVAMYPGKPLTL